MSHRKLGFHYFIRTALLGFFAYYILRLVKQDQLVIYIGPRMQPYVKLAAVGFYVMAVIQIYLAFRTWWGDRQTDAACGCGDCSPADSSRAGRAFFYALFAVPVLLFMLLPDQALSSSLVAKKGITLTGPIENRTAAPAKGAAGVTAAAGVPGASPAAAVSGAASPAPDPSPASTAAPGGPAVLTAGASTAAAADPLDALFPHDEYSADLAKLAKKLYKKDFISIQETGFMEVVSSVDFYMDQFIGKKVDISGFVYREADMAENQFVVSRFAVQCCSADASPFGFMVDSSLGKGLNKDAWVKVTGTLNATEYGGNRILKIDATKVERIPAPKTPYVFPDFDFFDTDIYD